MAIEQLQILNLLKDRKHSQQCWHLNYYGWKLRVLGDASNTSAISKYTVFPCCCKPPFLRRALLSGLQDPSREQLSKQHLTRVVHRPERGGSSGHPSWWRQPRIRRAEGGTRRRRRVSPPPTGEPWHRFPVPGGAAAPLARHSNVCQKTL